MYFVKLKIFINLLNSKECSRIVYTIQTYSLLIIKYNIQIIARMVQTLKIRIKYREQPNVKIHIFTLIVTSLIILFRDVVNALRAVKVSLKMLLENWSQHTQSNIIKAFPTLVGEKLREQSRVMPAEADGTCVTYNMSHLMIQT